MRKMEIKIYEPRWRRAAESFVEYLSSKTNIKERSIFAKMINVNDYLLIDII